MTRQGNTDTLVALSAILAQRKGGDPNDSYVASLYTKGLNKILEKVGEEATETILAAKDYTKADSKTHRALVGELADLWFHTMVMLEHLEIPVTDVLSELGRRQGMSGHAEKASRDQPTPGQIMPPKTSP